MSSLMSSKQKFLMKHDQNYIKLLKQVTHLLLSQAEQIKLFGCSIFKKVINKDDEVTYHFFEDNLNKIFSFLKNTKVDLIFLDIRMNSIDGRVLAEKIHILYPQIKFVFFTGLTITEKDLPLSISDSVLGILYKPFNEIQFENIIKKSREEKNILRVNMLGSFDCFINENIVNFSSAKSKELFALLLLLNGKSLTMDYAISVL